MVDGTAQMVGIEGMCFLMFAHRCAPTSYHIRHSFGDFQKLFQGRDVLCSVPVLPVSSGLSRISQLPPHLGHHSQDLRAVVWGPSPLPSLPPIMCPYRAERSLNYRNPQAPRPPPPLQRSDLLDGPGWEELF